MKNTLLKNLSWFEKSGVMLPADGLWGVAERVAVVKNNEAIEKMYSSFVAWTPHGDYSIIEQRRADCNFQAAYLFLLASEVFSEQKYYTIAVNILDFLYYRSGLLWRNKDQYPHGSWNWSHIKRSSDVYFDDESWCVFLQLEIGAKYPELEQKYEMKHWAMILADELCSASLRVMHDEKEKPDWVDLTQKTWLGRLQLPHWGSLTVMALARAWKENPKQEYLDFIQEYDAYLKADPGIFNVSECAYVVIGSSAAYRYTGDARYLETARIFGTKVSEKIQENGNIPAEHYEAPTGVHLVDTIYTVNWALLGLQALSAVDPEYQAACQKVMNLVIQIQDTSPEPQFNGCWRGMYDMEQKSWGGGDRFEGGAGSIYTGWTNAPISWVIALELQKKNLFT